MTADVKARRLATEFFGQWLGFYHFDQHQMLKWTRLTRRREGSAPCATASSQTSPVNCAAGPLTVGRLD